MRILMTLLITLALAALMACGSAADNGEKEGDPAVTAVPTATPKADEPTKEPDPPATAAPTETPKPDGEPTKTPEPTPAEKPTETPKPTRHPDDPPSPTVTPTPTYIPPPTEPPKTKSPATPRNRRPPHPDGITGCKSWNIFSSPIEDVQYLRWCADALGKDVADNCRPAEGTNNQLACGRDRMADVVDATNRGAAVCNAVTDDDDHRTCFNQNFRQFGINMKEIWEFWSPIQQKVDSDSNVKERKIAVGDCLVDQGYARPDPNAPIPWQERKSPTEKPDRTTTTEEQRKARTARHNAMDQCAMDVGLYDAQKELWITEVYSLSRENSDKARALKEHGLIAAMEMDGPPTFLQRRTRR